jgi:AcrR family transcriptional regulator
MESVTTDNRLNERKLTKREQIINSAIEIFLEEGYAEASVDRIAQHSGVAKQTVYSTFKNKRALFEAVIGVMTERSSFGKLDEEWFKLPLQNFLEKASELVLRQMADQRFPRFLRLITKECRMFPELQNLYGETISRPWLNFVARYLEHSSEVRFADCYAIAFVIRACLATFATESNFDPTGNYYRENREYFNTKLYALLIASGSREAHLQEVASEKTKPPSHLRGQEIQVAFGADKRGMILDGALRAFLQSGFTMTSMDDVAIAADVSKQTVYGYFTDKKTLFESLSDEVLKYLRSEISPPTDISNLKSFARDYLDHLSRPPIREFIRVVMGESQKFHASSDKYLLYLFRDYRQPLEDLLRTSLENEKDDAAFIATALIGTLADYSILQLIYSTADYTDLSSERVLTALFSLLALPS